MRWLSGDGLVAAGAVGGAVTIGLGWRGVVLLLAFFVSGSLLTQLSGGSGGRRTARQVLANGGVAALAAVAGSWTLAAGALAAATADTWATETGTLSRQRPRLITTGAPVAPGTSGGITLVGTAGGAAGAAFMAVLAWGLDPGAVGAGVTHAGWHLAAGVGLAGVLGMLADSLAGATLQGEYECSSCRRRSERGAEACHGPMPRVKGLGWLDNDGVNLIATLSGALAAFAWRSWA